MDKMIVGSGAVLNGQVRVSGAKNASLPLLFATLLAEGEHVFRNIPKLKDIDSALQLLKSLGSDFSWKGDVLRVTTKKSKSLEAHYDIVRKMRASILVLGPLLSRYGEAKVSLPGGCAIGTRPIDLHIEAMANLGAKIDIQGGYVHASCEKLQGGTIFFEKVTVGGTENALMAAVLSEGETIIENAAKEPEIVDLANYLIAMGAMISGAGTSIIRIQGVDRLKPAEHKVLPDRIEAGTLLIAGALTGGDVTVTQCCPGDLEAFLEKIRESGFEVECGENEMRVKPRDSWCGVDITTAPHPQFPTDLQAQFMSLMTQAQGISVVSETVFENRFMHVPELCRLNADITPKTQVAVVRGKKGGLVGAPVMATDLRASACLVLAGLVAEGETEVSRIYHLDRGYENLEKKLGSLGAKIKRVK